MPTSRWPGRAGRSATSSSARISARTCGLGNQGHRATRLCAFFLYWVRHDRQNRRHATLRRPAALPSPAGPCLDRWSRSGIRFTRSTASESGNRGRSGGTRAWFCAKRHQGRRGSTGRASLRPWPDLWYMLSFYEEIDSLAFRHRACDWRCTMGLGPPFARHVRHQPRGGRERGGDERRLP